MKRSMFILITLLVAIGLTACGSGSGGGNGEGGSGGEGSKTVSILTPYLSSVTTNEMVEALKQQAEEKGWKTNVIDTKGDVGQLASRMEDVVSSNTDAIILVSTDPNQLKNQIQRAAESNIPVFGCDSGYIDGMTMNATSDNAEMSQLISEYLLEQIDSEGSLVVLTHRPHPGVLARTVKLDEILEGTPGITKLTEQQVEVPGPIESARQQMESLLLGNQAEGAITAVWTGWDEAAIGAAQAIEAAGRTDIIVTGIDGNSQAVDMIEKGSPLAATVKQNFLGMTEIVIEQMELVFAGQPVEGTELHAPAELITR